MSVSISCMLSVEWLANNYNFITALQHIKLKLILVGFVFLHLQIDLTGRALRVQSSAKANALSQF